MWLCTATTPLLLLCERHHQKTINWSTPFIFLFCFPSELFWTAFYLIQINQVLLPTLNIDLFTLWFLYRLFAQHDYRFIKSSPQSHCILTWKQKGKSPQQNFVQLLNTYILLILKFSWLFPFTQLLAQLLLLRVQYINGKEVFRDTGTYYSI